MGSSSRSIIASSAASSRAAAACTRGGATESSRSRTGESPVTRPVSSWPDCWPAGSPSAGTTPTPPAPGPGEAALWFPSATCWLGAASWIPPPSRLPGRAVPPDPADELPHNAEAATDGDRAQLWGEVPGDEPDQRGLARAVRADQGRRRPFPDPERCVLEQHPAIRQYVAEVRHFDVTHAGPFPPHASSGCRADTNPACPQTLMHFRPPPTAGRQRPAGRSADLARDHDSGIGKGHTLPPRRNVIMTLV